VILWIRAVEAAGYMLRALVRIRQDDNASGRRTGARTQPETFTFDSDPARGERRPADGSCGDSWCLHDNVSTPTERVDRRRDAWSLDLLARDDACATDGRLM
jgi:hypothetical protein